MTDKCQTFVARWDHAMCSTCGEEHDRPAPAPTAPPALDLDAVEAAAISDLRAKLDEAKRLGLEACELAAEAAGSASEAPDCGEQVADYREREKSIRLLIGKV